MHSFILFCMIKKYRLKPVQYKLLKTHQKQTPINTIRPILCFLQVLI
jgi:hypothetical protein